MTNNENSIGLLDFLLALKRYRWLVIGFIVAGLLLGWLRSDDRPQNYYSAIKLGWIVDSGRVEALEVTDDIKRRVELAIQPAVADDFISREGVDERFLQITVANERDNKFVALTTRGPDTQGELQRAYHQAVLERIVEEQIRRFEWERQRYDREWGAQSERLEALRASGGDSIKIERLQGLAEEARARWAGFAEGDFAELEGALADNERRLGKSLRMARIRGLDEENLQANRRSINPVLYRRLQSQITQRNETRERLREAKEARAAEKRALHLDWKEAELKHRRVVEAHRAKVAEQQRIVDTYEANSQLFAKPRIAVVAKSSKVVGGKPATLVTALGAVLGLVLGLLAIFVLTLYQGVKRMVAADG